LNRAGPFTLVKLPVIVVAGRLRGHADAYLPPRAARGVPDRAARLLYPPRRCDVRVGRALWCAQTPLPSLPHLSLEPVCRRGWGSVYAALSHGEVGRVLWSGGVEGVVVDLGGVLELVAGS
jgi:hypothetical protein